jgi:ubiquinone/menaquinone biosynthesis C-methylase UbiE
MAAQLLAASAPADQVQLTVTDFDPVMVAAAQDRLQRFGDRAQARVADAAALPFGDDEFDTVVSFIMLHHVVDWEQALREGACQMVCVSGEVQLPGGNLV